jgi:RNA polymerase sigma-70 factor, ECF subfamily
MNFERELEGSRPILLGFARKLTRSMDAAEDLVQETMAKALRCRHLYEERSKVSTWAAKMMFRINIEHYRRQQRSREFTLGADVLATFFASAEQDPHAAFVAEETDRRVIAVLAHIPENLRTIFLLRFVDDVPEKEIAQMMNIPIGTVKSRAGRARAFLRKVVAQSETPISNRRKHACLTS